MMEAFDPDGIEHAVFVVGERHQTLDEPWRAYRRARLIHVNDGLLTGRTEAGLWVVPPCRALWLVANTLHCLHATRPVQLFSLYVATEPGATFADASGAALLPAQTGAL